MSTFLRIILLFLGGVVAPQILGFLCLRWAMRRRRSLLLAPAWLVAPALFFVFAYAFWSYQADSVRAAGHHLCGLFGAAAVFSTLYGLLLHLGLSCAIFLFILLWERRRRRLARIAPTADAAKP